MSLSKYLSENVGTSGEVIFYGGSFDPWHKGHTTCLELAPPETPIVVLPDNNPFKDNLNNNRDTDLEFIKNELRPIKKPIYLYTELMNSKAATPTIEWLKQVLVDIPTIHPSLLVGNDTFLTLHMWKDAGLLLKSIHRLYVVSRNDDERLTTEQIARLQKFSPSTKLVFLGEHPFEHLSSTELRKQKLKN